MIKAGIRFHARLTIKHFSYFLRVPDENVNFQVKAECIIRIVCALIIYLLLMHEIAVEEVGKRGSRLSSFSDCAREKHIG